MSKRSNLPQKKKSNLKGKNIKILRRQLIEMYHRWDFVIATGKMQKIDNFCITLDFLYLNRYNHYGFLIIENQELLFLKLADETVRTILSSKRNLEHNKAHRRRSIFKRAEIRSSLYRADTCVFTKRRMFEDCKISNELREIHAIND